MKTPSDRLLLGISRQTKYNLDELRAVGMQADTKKASQQREAQNLLNTLPDEEVTLLIIDRLSKMDLPSLGRVLKAIGDRLSLGSEAD